MTHLKLISAAAAVRPLGPRDLTIVIPALNEEPGIGRTLDLLRGESRLAGATIVVIDDGSTDRTAEIARQHGAEVLRNSRNLGYGASLKRGIRAAETELVAWFDADGQHDPADLAAMLQRLETEDADAVFGARSAGSYVVWSRVIGKRVLQLAANSAVGRRIPDINCGLRVFRRELLLEYLHLLPNGFSASTTTTLIYLKRDHRLLFHPIVAAERMGRSSVRQVRDGLRALHTITRVTVLFNALRTFGLAAAVLIAFGVVYGFSVALTNGLGFPVLAALAVILGVQLLGLGIVCDQVTAMRLEQIDAARWSRARNEDSVEEAEDVRHRRAA
jgi:glycosyltransferase involved in cell wall biosynthesis